MAMTKRNNRVRFLKRGFTSEEYGGVYVARATQDSKYVEASVHLSDSCGSAEWTTGVSTDAIDMHECFLEDLDNMEKFGMAVIAAAANARQVIEDAQAKQLELKFD